MSNFGAEAANVLYCHAIWRWKRSQDVLNLHAYFVSTDDLMIVGSYFGRDNYK